MEEALAKRQLDLASFDMLPRMALDAGYVGRNNVSASSSQSVETGTQSLEPSTSQDRDCEVADLTMVWNVLDFGVSHISPKPAGDKRDRKSVVEGKSVSVRVDAGGCRVIDKTPVSYIDEHKPHKKIKKK